MTFRVAAIAVAAIAVAAIAVAITAVVGDYFASARQHSSRDLQYNEHG